MMFVKPQEAQQALNCVNGVVNPGYLSVPLILRHPNPLPQTLVP